MNECEDNRSMRVKKKKTRGRNKRKHIKVNRGRGNWRYMNEDVKEWYQERLWRMERT